MTKQHIKVGIAPIGWSNDDMPELGGDISFEQCIQEMAQAGYDGCEVGHKFPRNPKQLKKALDPLNLQVASAWFSSFFSNEAKQKQSLRDFNTHCEFLSNMGSKVVVVAECEKAIQQQDLPILKHQPQLDSQEWGHFIKGLNEAGKIAQQWKLNLVYHYHMGTVVQQDDDIKRLMENTKPELVSLVFDTGHAYFAGMDPDLICIQYLDRIKHVHLKDVRSDVLKICKDRSLSFLDAVREGVFTVPGDGCIDFQPILNRLVQADYQGWWVVEAEQDPLKANPLVYAQLGRKTIKSLSGI